MEFAIFVLFDVIALLLIGAAVVWVLERARKAVIRHRWRKANRHGPGYDCGITGCFHDTPEDAERCWRENTAWDPRIGRKEE